MQTQTNQMTPKKSPGRPLKENKPTNAQRQKNYRDRKKMQAQRQKLTLGQIYNKTLNNDIDLKFLELDTDEFVMSIK